MGPDHLDDLPLPRLVAIAGTLIRPAWHHAIEEHGLPSSAVALMFVLADDGELTHNEAARRCWVTPGTLTNAVDALERAGYVERLPHPRDRRAIRLTLTPGGRTRVAVLGRVLRRQFGPPDGGLSDADAAVVRGYLTNLIRRLQAIPREGP